MIKMTRSCDYKQHETEYINMTAAWVWLTSSRIQRAEYTYKQHHDYKWCNTVSTSNMMTIDDMKQNTHVCNLKQLWLIDLFIICWKLLFLCKSWLILLALILLLFNYLNFIYTLLFRSCLNLFALLTLVNLRIFLLRSCSDLAQILLRSCQNYLLCQYLLTWKSSCSNLAQIFSSDLSWILMIWFVKVSNLSEIWLRFK